MIPVSDDKYIQPIKRGVSQSELIETLGTWEPIETAPKDGTKILAWHNVWNCPVAVFWDEGIPKMPTTHMWMEVTLTNRWPAVAFTHWMPMMTRPV